MTIDEFLQSILGGGGQPQNRLANPWRGENADPGMAMMPQMAQAAPPAAFSAEPPQMSSPMPQATPAPQQAAGGGNFLSRLFGGQQGAGNETVQWLVQQGYDPGTATALAGNKEALQKILLEQVANPMDRARFGLDQDRFGFEREKFGIEQEGAARDDQFEREKFGASETRADRGEAFEREKFDWSKESGRLTDDLNEYDRYASQEQAAGRQPMPVLDYMMKLKGQTKTNSFEERSAAAVQQGLVPGSDEYKRFVLSGELPSTRDQDPAFKNEMELRKEYDMLPEVKDYKVVRSNYERIQKGVELGTGAGDAAIVFGYMKMLDPTSVVREGEQASARNAAGVPESVRGMYNTLVGGGTLSEEARLQILSAADSVYGEASQNINDVNQRFGDIASQWQIDPSRIFAKPETYKARNAPTGLTRKNVDDLYNSETPAPGVREVAPGVKIRRMN